MECIVMVFNAVYRISPYTLYDAVIATQGVSIDNPISSSYRMGVKEAPLHDLYPAYVTRTLREAILAFERRMPGFISPGKEMK